MQATIRDAELNPLGIQVFVPDIQTKAQNISVNLIQNRARVIQAVLIAS
jgi:hypothetical protein